MLVLLQATWGVGDSGWVVGDVVMVELALEVMSKSTSISSVTSVSRW